MIIKSEEELDNLMSDLHTQSAFVCDLETQGLDPYKSGHRLIGAAISKMNGETFYIPWRHRVGTNLPLYTLKSLAPLFADPKKLLINHHVKFDVNFLEMDGIKVNNQLACTMEMAHLSNENEPSFALKKLGKKYLGISGEEEVLSLKLKSMGYGKGDMDRLPSEDVAPYAEQDTDLARGIFELYSRDLEAQGLSELWPEFGPYIKAIAEMERRGLPYDKQKCLKNTELAQNHVDELKGLLLPFGIKNPNSSVQVCKALGVSSSAREVLETMHDNPIVPLIQQYRRWAKVISTYYNVFNEVHDSNYRIHASVNHARTVTGRLAYSDPNLQALPKESDEYKVRDLITAPPGFTLVSFDCSQIELRFLAQYTQDPFLLDVYKRGLDIHTETANALNIVRDDAKRINFGIVYGIGKDSLATKIKKPVDVAAAYLAKYHKRIPSIKKLYRECEKIMRQSRAIEMWTGRLRHLADPEEAHNAMSALIQGGVGEMMRINMTKIASRIYGSRVEMLLQVHDELVFLIPTNELLYWLHEIKAIMEDYQFDIPIVAEAKYGPTWGSMKKWEVKK